MIKDKRILLTGCAGSIGSELTRQLAPHNKVFGLDNSEGGFFEIQAETGIFGRIGDVRDKATVFDAFSDFKPQVVINAAALKHVPYSQVYPQEYVQTNVLGTLNLIQEAKNWECLEKFVQISTDKVHSKSVMGATKRCAELITTSMGVGFVAVRFGNVLGSRGSVIPTWQKQVDDGEPITITDEKMERYFMTIKDACELVIEASQIGEGGEVICVDMGKPQKIIDLKNKLFPDHPIKIIGLREGEVLTERMMTTDEEKLAIKKNKFFIIK